ncbi:hypothetical protein D9M68_971800 [compost metagenome]
MIRVLKTVDEDGVHLGHWASSRSVARVFMVAAALSFERRSRAEEGLLCGGYRGPTQRREVIAAWLGASVAHVVAPSRASHTGDPFE